MEQIQGFKFSLDLSDFEKAPEVIRDALTSIQVDAKKNGQDADVAMTKYLKDLIKERETAVKNLKDQLESATKSVASAYAMAQKNNTKASWEEYDKAVDVMYAYREQIAQVEKELSNLHNAENDLAKDRSFLTNIKTKVKSFDLYGKAMAMLPAPIANVIQSSKLLNKALMALSTNPVVLTITGLVIAMKALSGYADMMANKFESWTVIFGTVTEAVRKFKEVITAIITLDWKDFVYNLTNIFDGGEREIEKRNAKLQESEHKLQNAQLQEEVRALNKRAMNRKRSFDERRQAQEQANAKELQILKNNLDDQSHVMRDFYKDNNLYHPEWNPKGLKTSEEEIDTAQRTQLNELKAERQRIMSEIEAQKDINQENLYKLRQQESEEWSKMVDKQLQELEKTAELYKKRKEYQRNVAEQMEAESQRLKQMAQQTENQAIQAQINKMADGIEKVTAQAKQKTKEALQSLDKALYDEAYKLWGDEKKLFDGNPSNEGKMFKSFKIGDYIQQAKKNIGYEIKEGLISDDEIYTTKKAVDAIVKDALDGAKKVDDEVKIVNDRIKTMSKNPAPQLFEEFSLGFKEYYNNLEQYRNIYDDLSLSMDRSLQLERERIVLMDKIKNAGTEEERVKLSEELVENQKESNKELEKTKNLEGQLKNKSNDVSASFQKIKSNAVSISGGISQIASEFKGISDSCDDMVEAIELMLGMFEKIMQGDIIGTITEMFTFMAKKIAETIKKNKQLEEEAYENAQHQKEIMQSLRDAAEEYKMSLIGAKDAQDELYNTTKIQAMTDAMLKLNEAQDKYNKYVSSFRTQGYRGQIQTGLSPFVDQMMSAEVDVSSSRNEVKKTMISLDKYISQTFGKALFDLDEKGEYQLNTDIWDSIKANNTALEMFTETQVKTIDHMAELQALIAEAQDEYAKNVADWYSPLLDNMTDAMMDWLSTNEDIMDKFKDYSSDTFRSIVKDLLKNMLYKDLFKQYASDIEKATKTYLSNDDQQGYAQAIAQTTDQLIKDMNDAKSTYKQVWDTWESEMNKIGIDMSESTSSSSEARGIARASQESVDENNARLAMMQQHTYSINANVQLLTQTSSQMLYYLQGIHSHTSELSRLSKIESSLSNIETYGVRTR